MINNIMVLNGINSVSDFCNQSLIVKLTYYIGIIIMVLKIAIPIILIVLGSFELTKAITEQNDDATKKAVSSLITKAVIGVAIFLVPTIVGLLMNIIGQKDYKSCMTCISNAFSTSCQDLRNNSDSNDIPYSETCEGSGGKLNGNKCECPEGETVSLNRKNQEYCVIHINIGVPNFECKHNIEVLLVSNNQVVLVQGENWNGAKSQDIQRIKYRSKEISNYTINNLKIVRIEPFDKSLGEEVSLKTMLSKRGKYRVYYSMGITFTNDNGNSISCTKEDNETFHYVKVE